MYTEFAHLWRQISSVEEYAEEAAAWRDALFDLLQLEPAAPKPRIIEFGTGGGNHLSFFTPFCDATAVDPAPLMLEESKKLNPGVRHLAGDMRDFRLGEKFDAALIHDAISYMLTEADLAAAFATARAHLNPGGVFITGPDWMRGVSDIPNISSKLGKPGELSYTEYVHDPDPADTQIELVFTFYIPQPDGSVRTEEDRHQHGLFPLQTWLRLMREAGFEAGTRSLQLEDDAGPGYLVTGVAI
jgi:SAM-dependent methyltransferase